jgi:hypothetical protein
MTEGCVFCDHDGLREADPYFENEFCIYASTRDPRDPPDVIPGGGIVPRVHRASVFDLTAEWAATRELLLLVGAELHKRGGRSRFRGLLGRTCGLCSAGTGDFWSTLS